MALGTLTMSKSGRMPACFDTASGGAAAGTYNASTVCLIPSGMVAVAPMLTSGFTCLYLSAQGLDSTAGATGKRGLIGVTGAHGTIAVARKTSGTNYIRVCKVQIERINSGTVTMKGPSQYS